MGSRLLEDLGAAVEGLLAGGLEPVDADEAEELIGQLERLGRRVDAAKVELLAAIDRVGLHAVDGHASAKVMVRHVARLSNPEATRRAKAALMLRDLPAVRSAFGAGVVGRCQVDRFARADANPRVRDRLPEFEELLLAFAASKPYVFFNTVVTDFVRRVDEDGTCGSNQLNHENRNWRIVQDYEGSWRTEGRWASLQGPMIQDTGEHFYGAETAADWEKARAEHGDAATVADLARTDAQRRADALLGMCLRAGSTEPGGARPTVVTNIVIDQPTYERELAKIAGHDPGPVDPTDERFRCSTLDGAPIEPTEAVTASLVSQVRRVVIDATSTVIDLSRTVRLFTGSARLAVQLRDSKCYWPRCHTPVSHCQIDHLTPFTSGARTNPGNGGPACGKHDRHKQHGYTARRDNLGHWHIHRPNGTPSTSSSVVGVLGPIADELEDADVLGGVVLHQLDE